MHYIPVTFRSTSDVQCSMPHSCFVLAILPSLWLSSHSLHIPAMFSWGGPRGNSQLTLFGHGSGSLRCRWPYQQRRPCLITFSMLDRPYPFLKTTLKCFYNLFLVEVLKKNLRNIKLWENLKLVNTTPFDKMKGLLLKENCIHILPISVILEWHTKPSGILSSYFLDIGYVSYKL